MTENHSRSVLKAFSWRIIATLTTMVLVYIFTKQWILTISIGFFDITSKLLFYYLHERAWNRISWGKDNK
jgi:uncharacterized membrane protein